MDETKDIPLYWRSCDSCQGQGKTRQRIKKKAKLLYRLALEEYQKSDKKKPKPEKPRAAMLACKACGGMGIVRSSTLPQVQSHQFPHVAIIGGGIGGVALAIACQHRGIPFTLFERDESFDARSQGYGLTLQQATKAVEGLGLGELKEGIVSTRHLVHNAEGKVLGEWGMRKWGKKEEGAAKRTNIHIARQALRKALLDQLQGENPVQWDHQLLGIEKKEQGFELQFITQGKTHLAQADVVVGADGIRSTVRKLTLGEEKASLRYLGCIVILGICPLNSIATKQRDLLDGKTVFQTANGTERIYMMPYSKEEIMWQLSFPLEEKEAIKLSQLGCSSLKEEAIRRLKWHAPIPEILSASPENLITGYPVYDRPLLEVDDLKSYGNITLLGDAAHPMSPFKGQGANQALLDALQLAKRMGVQGRNLDQDSNLRERVLNDFEEEMITRSKVKVEDSAAAADFLHSDIVLHPGNEPRGKIIKDFLD